MKICIHRGTNEIGGSAIELLSGEQSIIIDMGIPLEIEKNTKDLIPPTMDLNRINGIVISHCHLDHYGLLKHINKNIPIAIGQSTQNIINTANRFYGEIKIESKTFLEDRKTFKMGNFTITPHLTDHSAYDAYSFLIEADGQKVFYSGDIRANGRKSSLFNRMISNPPKDIDIFIMEGTNFRENTSYLKTEEEVEKTFFQEFESVDGGVFVMTSSQNIDRMVSLFKACRKANRNLIIDFYTAEILKATANENIPQGTWNKIKVYLPNNQKQKIKQNKAFDLIDRYKENRIYEENLPDEISNSVILLNKSVWQDIGKYDFVKNTKFIYSMWDGYLKKESLNYLRKWLDSNNITLKKIHCSGHASVNDLQKLAETVDAKALIPIHTVCKNEYKKHFKNTVVLDDGICFDINNLTRGN